MVIDITQLALTVGVFLAQQVLSKGTDIALDAVWKKLLAAIHARSPEEDRVLDELEKDPADERRKAELIERLSVTIGADPDFHRQIAAIVQELLQSGWVMPAQPPPAAPHQLPADLADFTGREKEVGELLAAAEQERIAPAVLVVTGLGGAGKTALAVHAAHLLKEHCPHVQLYADLRGAGSQPSSPLDVLVHFLVALGYEQRDIPKELEERAALYRSALSNCKALILLDNARDETQVRPLLPGGSGCVVLITSRWSLHALEGVALRQELSSMQAEDALALLARCAGQDPGSFTEPQAARRIVRLCGSLPLAVRIAGGHLGARAQKWAEYAASLEDERQRLELLQLDDKDVRASFLLSYHGLSPWEARLFRRLGLLEGKSFSAQAALALDGGSQKHVWNVLERLVHAQLIAPVGARYLVHDLVHLLAKECLRHESTAQQNEARLRLARWYAGEARAMNEWVQPDKRRKKLQELRARGERIERAGRGALTNALSWFETERADLRRAVECAYENAEWEMTWQLAMDLEGFYNLRGHWQDWEHTHLLALEATRRKPDEGAQGIILNLLGNVYRLQGRWEQAASTFREALELNRRLQNTIGESIALNLLANVYRLQGRWDEAIAGFQESLDLNTRTGNERGRAIALGGLGNVYRMQGCWQEALFAYEMSLEIAAEQDDPHGRSIALNNKALVCSRQGSLKEAEALLEQSLAICREMETPKGECIARRTLGEVYMLQRRWDEALEQLTRSLEMARRQRDWRCTAQTLDSLGEWYTMRGQWEQAGECFEEERSILRSLDDRHDEGLALRSEGRLRWAQGKYGEAERLWHEALEKLNPASPEYPEVKTWLEQPGVFRKLRRLLS